MDLHTLLPWFILLLSVCLVAIRHHFKQFKIMNHSVRRSHPIILFLLSCLSLFIYFRCLLALLVSTGCCSHPIKTLLLVIKLPAGGMLF